MSHPQISGAGRPIALTLGDPLGIGPEIAARLLADPARSRTPIVVIGDPGVLRRAARLIGVDLDLCVIGAPDDLATAQPRGIPVISPGSAFPDDAPIGRIDPRAGAAAYEWILAAADLALAGAAAAIVTGPVNKAALGAAGFSYPGQTEILAARAGVPDVSMMLANGDIRVLLVSVHESLADAIRRLTPQRELAAILRAAAACRAEAIDRPRIAVAALNPHAGEGGLFGREDLDVIAPAIAEAQAMGLDVTGPLAGDTVFMRARRGEFDIVVAQYHDQGLIPVKYLGLDDGVNISVGLPFVRTSPDHGTAFDIAGKGCADHASLAAAFHYAERLCGLSRGDR